MCRPHNIDSLLLYREEPMIQGEDVQVVELQMETLYIANDEDQVYTIWSVPMGEA